MSGSRNHDNKCLCSGFVSFLIGPKYTDAMTKSVHAKKVSLCTLFARFKCRWISWIPTSNMECFKISGNNQ